MSTETEGASAPVPTFTAEYLELKKELIEIASILEKFPESLKANVFELLMAEYRGDSEEPKCSGGHCDEEGAATAVETTQPKGTKTRKKLPDSFSLDPDLNLHGTTDIPSFEKFCEEKKPAINAEFNTVAVYYITKILGKPRATLSKVWTCYKDLKRRTPEFFRQSMTDTKNQKGYIRILQDGEMETTPRGENLVEHDLPAKD